MNKNLQLQRASAGSGKTFALARKYLWYFLTIKEENAGRRLRTIAELRDSMRHILAVTFTNKATNEMQQRIVDKLFALAYPDSQSEKRPDYEKDFCKALNVSQKELQRVCRLGIVVLLENYSDFQVSTIDSFFQLVLRTFAYETDLNDSYGIELDSDFLSKVGVDGVFEDVEQGIAGRSVEYWLKILMETQRRSGKGWNIFQRRESRNMAGNTSYGMFLDQLRRLQNEDFKAIRKDLQDYFRRNPDLQELYEGLCRKYEEPVEILYRKMRSKAKDVKKLADKWIDEILSGEKPPQFIKYCKQHAEKLMREKPFSAKASFTPQQMKSFEGAPALKMVKIDPDLFSALRDEYFEMLDRKVEWEDSLNNVDFKQWQSYKRKFPLLGLLSATMAKRDEYLADNNSVELSETNTLLQKIIGGSDTPFVYERLGTRLNNYLIDEFQDTSAMQWQNFRPLLLESISRGEENLLIGDAKQSIYRFRNADPSLISFKVEREFRDLTIAGNSAAENTNWRSDRKIVEFNNALFKFLASGIQAKILEKKDEEKAVDNTDSYNFENLYSNVEQEIHNTADRGYVEVNFSQASGEEYSEMVTSEVVQRIEQLLRRGYMMRDIAVLVDKNSQADKIVQAFIRHNSENPENRQIAFVSEESLKLTSSGAVKVILATLSSISDGVVVQVRKGEDRVKKGVADWNQIKSEFRLFAKNYLEMNNADILQLFLKGENHANSISSMLAKMQAVTLPAIVEGIVSSFVGDQLSEEDAPFIAAFQDIVLEYCESHPSDIASFLKWWERRKDKFSITSPVDQDAVMVMTIHKSKGLEFPCVIVPFASADFVSVNENRAEWKWVRPTRVRLEGYEMPPFIPVDTTKGLQGTDHEQYYWKALEMTTMDSLNKLYVALTRAVNELYIFTNASKRGSKFNFTNLLLESLALPEDTAQYQYGEPYAEAEVKRGEEEFEIKEMKAYSSMPVPDCIKYKMENTPDIKDADDVEAGDFELDPREVGNVYHQIMQRIVTLEDIRPSVKYLQRKGLLTPQEGEEAEELLKVKLSDGSVKRWFDGSRRVINERSIVGGGGAMSRPDRIMVDKDGNAEVIDYKFGDCTNQKRYYRQLKRYVDSLKSTGRFRSVKGWLWYLRHGAPILVAD